MDKFMIL